MEEVPLSLEEAFVRYMGGPSKSVAFVADEHGESADAFAPAAAAAGGVA